MSSVALLTILFYFLVKSHTPNIAVTFLNKVRDNYSAKNNSATTILKNEWTVATLFIFFSSFSQLHNRINGL